MEDTQAGSSIVETLQKCSEASGKRKVCHALSSSNRYQIYQNDLNKILLVLKGEGEAQNRVKKLAKRLLFDFRLNVANQMKQVSIWRVTLSPEDVGTGKLAFTHWLLLHLH
jgi:hypothetical protein